MAQKASSTAMPRRAMIYFTLAFVALLTALSLLHRQIREIDWPTAARRADRLLALYVRDSGQPPLHFIAAGAIDYSDGWEFAWRYRPCPDIAMLKIFIGRSGSATYSALPDCTPKLNYAVTPAYI